MSRSRAIDALAWTVGRLRPASTVTANGMRPVKVNIGSGLRVAPGWINLDGSVHALCAGAPPALLRRLYRSASTAAAFVTEDQYVETLRTERFVHHVLERPLPFADESIDYLYSSHVLEHLYREQAIEMLAECHRVLRKGGVLRLGVPDLAHAVACYQAGDREQALGYFFQDRTAGTYRRHRYMYDYSLLEEALRAVGFRDVERRRFREGVVPDLDRLDSLPEETLFAEAKK